MASLMTNEEYENTLHQVMLVANLVRDMDVDGLRQRFSHAHAVGPILDPTGYQDILYGRGGKSIRKLEAIEAIVDAACQFRAKVNKAFQSIPAEEVGP